MFQAIFLFLGVAVFILAASIFFSRAKRAGKTVEIDLAALQAASVCLSAGRRGPTAGAATGDQEPSIDEKAKWQEMKALWMSCYAKCQERALLKQKSTYRLARTMVLCASLCLIGVVLEITFDEPITFDRIVAGFKHSPPAAKSLELPQSQAHVATTN